MLRVSWTFLYLYKKFLKKTLQGTFEQVSINTININADIEHESYNLNTMLILFHMHLHEYFTWFWLLFKSKSLKELSI